ncbi:GNAT family N-acetyltransferase [Chitinophaga sp. Cy-1792]|uniref:GNAT family N-acetyltransferase n=1 Tax=Chitinophaga sp. Cy-1792 TaxID=2608339 RepID=UPI001965DCCC|nr:GNAT family N-acetyltransferase [Chitinophaga sp. Cy-1792]
MNDFLFNHAHRYSKELLTVTYLVETDTETVAFFSLLNDKISFEDASSKNQWKKIQGHLHGKKRTPANSFPAAKIGRLGVTDSIQNQGIGASILDFIKNLFLNNNKTGCKFITVDAYHQSVKFYEKNGFRYFPAKSTDGHTAMMYFDLIYLD